MLDPLNILIASVTLPELKINFTKDGRPDEELPLETL